MTSVYKPKRQRVETKKSTRSFPYPLFIIIPLLIVLAAGAYYRKNIQTFISQISSFYKPHPTLTSVVENKLPNSGNDEYGIVIHNLKTNEEYTLHDHEQFKSASLYKLWVMAVAFQQIQAGVLNENEVLSDDVIDLNQKFNIASESAELQDGTITLSVHDALEQMITISHNYAALLLTERIGVSNLENFVSKYQSESNLDESTDEPDTTPHDIAIFLQDLYAGKLANQQYSNEMMDLLKRQELNNKLPLYLPKNTVIAHKTGEIDSFSHDAGIVFTKDGDYIIVIFSNSNIPANAEERIGQISKAVFNYFQEKAARKLLFSF